MAQQPKTSLASSLTLLVLTVVGVSVAIVGIAALGGVFDLARGQIEANDQAYRQAASAEIVARLSEAEELLDRSARIVEDPEADKLDRTRLAREYELAAGYVDQLVVADTAGTALTTIPAFRAVDSVASLEGFSDQLPEQPVFAYSEEESSLWVMRSTTGVRGEHVIMARVRLGFLETMLDEFASARESRWVAVTSAEGSPVATSEIGPVLNQASIELDPDEDEAGAGSLTGAAANGEIMWGQYGEIQDFPGLDWVVMVAEPRAHVVWSTGRALSPAIVTLVLAILFAVSFAALFSRRLVSPIRLLERRVRDAVSGAYVRPIEIDRTDEIGQLSEAFNAVTLRLNSLHDLSQLLASSSNVDQVLDGIMSAMGHIVGSTSIAVFLVDNDRGLLVLERTRGIPGSPDLSIPLDEESWIIEMLDAEGPIAFKGAADNLAEPLNLMHLGSVTGLAAPLVVGSEPVGVVAVIDIEHRGFSQAEMEMVRTFSAQAAVAVHNSRLFEIEADSRREAEALRIAAERLAAHGDLDDALHSVMNISRDLLGVAWSAYAIVDRPSLSLSPPGDAAKERGILRAWGRAAVAHPGDSLVVMREGEDAVIDGLLATYGGREILLTTSMRGENPGGVLAFGIDDPEKSFSPRAEELAGALSQQVALALENAYYLAEASRRAGDLETIFRISQALGGSLDIKVVLNRVLDVVQKIFSADAVSLMIFDSQKRVIETVMARGLVSSEILHYECRPGETIPGRVFASGTPAKIDDLHAVKGAFAELAIGQGLQSALAVPLLARAHSLGVLAILSSGAEMFTKEDMSLLHTFASQAALAIDTAEMYGREHTLATVLQASILPETLPAFPEIETSTVYLPASEDAEIGGDYYDVFRAADGRLVLAIGDVCGKGVLAATKTSMIKYTIRGLAAAGLRPAAIMAEVNRIISESGAPSDIVTLWVGILEIEEGHLVYANGGHPPALLRRSEGGSIVRLDPTGPLLGAVASAEYDEECVEMSACDVVLLYTDGVTEARREGKFFGEGRVRRSLSYGGAPDDVTGRLLAALDRFAPGDLRDDAAVLAVRVREDAEFASFGAEVAREPDGENPQ